VSYGIVQAHGGEIDVHSEPGEGTTIVLSLPSADQPADARPSDVSNSHR
jgi:signal transduction histidine kinase